MLYRLHKNSQIAEIKAGLTEEFLSGPYSEEPSLKVYKDQSTTFWSDRSYHSDSVIEELVGLDFVEFPREINCQILVRAHEPVQVYVLSNRTSYSNLDNWEYVREILVYDESEPRSFNSLYTRILQPGDYIMSNHPLLPSRTIFFPSDKAQVFAATQG